MFSCNNYMWTITITICKICAAEAKTFVVAFKKHTKTANQLRLDNIVYTCIYACFILMHIPMKYADARIAAAKREAEPRPAKKSRRPRRRSSDTGLIFSLKHA